MDNDTKYLMMQAKKHIQAKRYADARKVLKLVNHPTARQWEQKLDNIAPPKVSKTSPKRGGGALMYLMNLLLALLFFSLIGVGVFIFFYRDTYIPRLNAILNGNELAPPENVERPADQRFLFIGNSFTFYNNLDQMVARLAEEAVPEWNDVLATRYAPGGWKLTQHLADAQNPNSTAPIREYLITGSDVMRDWDLVVLQGQSQVAGFDSGQASKQQLLAAVPELVRYADDTGATTLFMMTWGYAEGDAMNPGYYSDYLEMQGHIWRGYDELAQAGARVRLNAPVYVAPAGLGYQQVYRDIEAEGNNPLAAGSRFRQLYSDDMRHPGLPGSYLAANIVVASYTGQRMSAVDWVPPGLDAEFAAYLRDVADRVVFGTRFGSRNYPWN